MSEREEDFPFEGTEATRMLREGLRRAADERGLSTRGAARELGYKATVVISHMATGRVPIPLDRAAEIADVVGIDKIDFYRAVLEQRYPGSKKILEIEESGQKEGTGIVADLCLLAGGPLDDLPDEHKRVLREVVSERAPARRWLSLAELPVMLAIRRAIPDVGGRGMRADEIERLQDAIRSRG